MVCFLLPQDKGGAFYSLVGGGVVPSTVRVYGTLNLDHVLGSQNMGTSTYPSKPAPPGCEA